MLITTARDLGAAIRARRKLLGMNQTELAERVGVGRRWLTQVENGKSGAEIGLLLRTLNALGLEMTLSPQHENRRSTAEPLIAPDLDAVLARARRKDGE
ncbi:MAG: helix-turn-helix domain-containing protein [Phenylobacterium sp.]|uniref:helix-turn-helix domain-containing protein n=1 Tax=Phenylobacterium sp. TaxID=1871053 RepID=UPI00391A6BEF